MANITDKRKVKNVSNNTPVIFGKYVILPGQVTLVDNTDWNGKEMWRKFNYCIENNTKVRLLENYHLRAVVNEDNAKTLKYAINTYLAATTTPEIQTVIEGVHYKGKVVGKGSNSLIFFKEAVITPKPVTAVTINQEAPTVSVGSTTTLTATITPTDATDPDIVWESETPAKATVNPTTGVVTGVATGKTNIYAISVESGVHDVVKVTVTAAPV